MSEYGSICLNNTWMCLNMPEHGWILLNIPEYAWKCPNKLFCLCHRFSMCLIILDIWQNFEFASGIKYRSSHRRCDVKKVILKNFENVTGKHLCWSFSLTKLQAWGTATLLKNKLEKGVFLRNLQNFWENVLWRTSVKDCFYKYARVLNMPLYSYNNIISIVTNNIILEFLSAQFIHPDSTIFLISTRLNWYDITHP